MTGNWCMLVATAVGLLTLTGSARAGAQAPRKRIPVVLDSDIGSDIDDAFALAMVLQSQAIDLKAVTTVSEDTAARARIAAKMLWLDGRDTIPVAAGPPGPIKALPQARWADGFTSPALVQMSAVKLLHTAIQKNRGQVVLIALGPLSNVAALLQQHPEDRRALKEIVLMGGSINHGYQPGSGPAPEYNVAADPPAASAVFSSGVPLLVAPLDVTAGLQMDAAQRQELFAHRTPLTTALQQLYTLWGQPTPTLYDPMAVSLLLQPQLCQRQRLHIVISAKGMTEVRPGPPNAEVALHTDPTAFFRYYQSFFQRR